jgi:hypothetical protein
MTRAARITKARKKQKAKFGRMGGDARAKNLTPERRREISMKASRASAKARARKAKERKTQI